MELEVNHVNCLLNNKDSSEGQNRIHSFYNVLFTMSRIQSNYIRHMKKHTKKKRQSVVTDPEMTQMLELEDKGF